MHHITHIRFVYTHTESIGGYHYFIFVKYKPVLKAFPFIRTKTCMIFSAAVPGGGQIIVQGVHPVSGGAVNNSAVFPVVFNNVQQCPVLFFRPDYRKAEVGPVKACGHTIRLVQFQQAAYILFYPPGGCGGKSGQHRSVFQQRYKLRYFKIAGAEILPPPGHTVGFIHSNHAYIYLPAGGKKRRCEQSFRRHINHFISATLHVIQRFQILIYRKGTIEISRRYTVFIE